MKQFIEKCILPQSQRLSAKELLKDPFFQVDMLAITHSLHLPDIVTPKMGAFGDRCLLSEGPISAQSRHPSMDVDADYNDRWPIINVVEASANGGSHSPCLEVRRAWRDNFFSLKGEVNDEKSLSLILRIADNNG